MGRHSGCMVFMSFLVMVAGFVMLMTGLRSEGPNNMFEGFDKAGIVVLVGGGILLLAGLILLRRG